MFVDTSAFYGEVSARDARHSAAAATFRKLAAESRPIVTSNLIVAETHGLVMRRLGRDAASLWLNRVPYISVIYQSEGDDEVARDIIARYADKAFSYTDAVSFAVMERFGLTTAFAFDDDFRQYGWNVIP